VIYKTKFKFTSISNRTRIEYHITDRFWRYRDKINTKFLINKNLIPWIGYEVRYFLKENRIGMSEIFVGMFFKMNNTFSVNIFYDYRKKIKQDTWVNTNCLRTDLNFNF
ncbi:hypothetical protein DRQ09_10615, partial [candidate division KSB1 bacterium]